MKKRILLGVLVLSSAYTFGQMQIGNSGFENWESADSGEEPVNWNSFETAQGTWSGFGGVQIQQSSDVRPGSTGTKSARIYSTNPIGSTIANANLTLGIINMGSTTPSSSSNYNISLTGNPAFSEVLTDSPDSLVFWAKFTPASGSTTDSARVKATIHDAYDYRDPEDAASTMHVVATAVKNYATTNGQWVRFSIPFAYTGPASTPEFILITFTSNKTPGGGSENDQVWVDDVELIYNPTGNQQIVANDDTYGGDQDNDIVCDVLTNDVDPEGMIDLTSLTVVSDATNGSTAVNTTTGEITYTPNPGYSGSDAFTYQVCDQGSPATCDFGTVNLTVNFVGITEINIAEIGVKAVGNSLHFSGVENLKGEYVVYNLMGGIVKKGALTNQTAFNEKSGIYLVSIQTEVGTVTKRIYKN